MNSLLKEYVDGVAGYFVEEQDALEFINELLKYENGERSDDVFGWGTKLKENET